MSFWVAVGDLIVDKYMGDEAPIWLVIKDVGWEDLEQYAQNVKYRNFEMLHSSTGTVETHYVREVAHMSLWKKVKL